MHYGCWNPSVFVRIIFPTFALIALSGQESSLPNLVGLLGWLNCCFN
uniref:Uncharacterized protein n=1 Tax=Anguilla anguilla TaxID=7936 RepID=A0A0E9UK19_ANGAN